MNTIYEKSERMGGAHVSCVKYRNLNNISHYHSDYELIYVEEGSAEIIVDEKTVRLLGNECAFVNTNDIHCIRSDKNTIIIVLKLEEKYFGRIFSSKKLVYPKIKSDIGVRDTLKRILDELSGGKANFAAMADALSVQLMVSILRREETVEGLSKKPMENRIHKLYNDICEKISAEYASITFEEMAQFMHFSQPYFSKVFSDIFGMTFTKYLNTVRITAAIEFLRDGNMGVTEISSKCGFNTIRNFNRVFKKFTGYPPNKLPEDYVFLYSLKDGFGLNPTLNSTEILT